MTPRFRSWHKTREELGEVERIRFDDEGNVSTVLVIGKSFGGNIYIDKIELMQSTGLFDKNGQEIFEGDVLKFNDEWAEYCHEGYVDGSVEGINFVEVVRGEACFEFGKTKYPESSLFIRMEDEHLTFAELIKSKDFEFEIIGNIYENKEFGGRK